MSEFKCNRFSCEIFVDQANSLDDVLDRDEWDRIAVDCSSKASECPGEIFDNCPYKDMIADSEGLTKPAILPGHAQWLKEFLEITNA